ncbi:GDP-mannose 4,6-dehydratase [Camelimonas abortus]|uniref:GDP-mannose 4,6-dehydratase n=1 Tax=Camelimonas abortus TaxID=1017184 RepID=A0ABV7LFX5_9HYPH
MTRRALITGITGQDGGYLAQFLLEKNYEVYGVCRRNSAGAAATARLQWLGVLDRVRLVEADMLDQASLIRALEEVMPHEVYNLAAQSHVMTSFRQPLLTGSVTAMGAVNLLEAVRLVCPRARYYQASSSEMFGRSGAPAQNELTPFRPCSPYGAAKLYAHWMTVAYRDSYGLHACCGVLFNHESPLRGEGFVTRRISRGVAAIRAGHADELRLGDLDARRDWGHARDYVEAMWMMLQLPEPVDLVIATGVSMSVRELCAIAFAHAGLDWERHVRRDPALERPLEIRELRGDASLARRLLGWAPRRSAADTIREMVDADLARAGAPGEAAA